MKRSRQPLSPKVLSELPQRLYDAAEAFYFGGILCSLPFDAEHVDSENHRHAPWAANAAISGANRTNNLGAPPIVNFGFAIELYIKLLHFLANGRLVLGHDLRVLFLDMESVAPNVAAAVINRHFYCGGDRGEFLEDISDVANVFEEWRYAYEKSLLCASADSLLTLANAFRNTVRELHPTLNSAFRLRAEVVT